jgi:acyl carrier protein
MEVKREDIVTILDKYIFNKKVWENVPENPRIVTDLKINSARVVDIVLDLEEKYDIEIDDESLKRILTIDDIIREIKTRKA